MKVALIGITGRVGSRVADELLKRGHQVTGIARNLGVSESIIGLTLVAGGTSLPELATSIVAALKKNPESLRRQNSVQLYFLISVRKKLFLD